MCPFCGTNVYATPTTEDVPTPAVATLPSKSEADGELVSAGSNGNRTSRT
jgi:hypothetical protein